MSFTIICDHCNTEYGNYFIPDVVICDSCGQEGCEICLDLVKCNDCDILGCPNCLDISGVCFNCLNENNNE